MTGCKRDKKPWAWLLVTKEDRKGFWEQGDLSWTWILNCLRGSSVRYLDSPSDFSLASALSCLWQSIVFKQWNSYCCWPRSMLYDITCVRSSLVTNQHVYLERPALGIFDLRVCIGNLCLLSGTVLLDRPRVLQLEAPGPLLVYFSSYCRAVCILPWGCPPEPPRFLWGPHGLYFKAVHPRTVSLVKNQTYQFYVLNNR